MNDKKNEICIENIIKDNGNKKWKNVKKKIWPLVKKKKIKNQTVREFGIEIIE